MSEMATAIPINDKNYPDVSRMTGLSSEQIEALTVSELIAIAAKLWEQINPTRKFEYSDDYNWLISSLLICSLTRSGLTPEGLQE
jgi:hypothetical protein